MRDPKNIGLGVRSLYSTNCRIFVEYSTNGNLRCKSRTFAYVKDFCGTPKNFFLIFIFRAFSILHFTIYVDNACVAKTTKFSELRKLLPTNDAQGNPTRGTAQARSRGPSPFRGRAHPRSRGGPRAAKMGTKICYQGSWASQIASHESREKHTYNNL